MNKKIFITIILGLIMNGCTGVSNYYVLSITPKVNTTYKSSNEIIGIERVVVPKYLFKRQIAIATTNNKIDFLSNAEWGEDLDIGLTQRLIYSVQKKFKEPRVYEYPWEISETPDKKIKVEIAKFIKQGNKVYLDASWSITNKSNKNKSKLFTTSSIVKDDEADSIVEVMEELFGRLEKDVMEGLRTF